jgi:hypothetical protein
LDGGTTLEAGMTLGNYVVENQLGQGTEGHVFLARDSLLGRRVALKLPASGRAGEMRGIEEARICAKLEHPSVVRAYHAFRHKGVWLIVYEYADAGTVESRVRAAGPYPTQEALELAAQAASALAYLHAEGFLHRDVKPHNLLLGRQHQIKLADFGLALDLRSPEAHSARPVGTPAFLAPELWREAPATTASDVYSLGICLYFMLFGAVPFPYAQLEPLRHAHLTQEPALPKRLPRGVMELLASLLAKEPAQRPSSAELPSMLATLVRDPHEVQRRAAQGEPAALRLTEPFSAEALERASLAVFDGGEERLELEQLLRLLGARVPSLLVCSDRPDELELLLKAAVARAAGSLQTVARAYTGQVGTALMSSLSRGSEVPTFSSLAALLDGLATTPAARADVVSLIEVHLGGAQASELAAPLAELRKLAASRGQVVVCTAALQENRTEDRSVELAHLLDASVLSLGGSHIGSRRFSDRVRRWAAAANERVRFSPDAMRALFHAYRGPGLPWMRLVRESVLIAGAAQLPVVTSWAVQGATRLRKRLHELSGVPAELRRRPACWPTADAAELLLEWRRDEAREDGALAEPATAELDESGPTALHGGYTPPVQTGAGDG